MPTLYAKLFPKPKDRREAMGLTHPDIVSFIADEGLESCLERVKSDNAFVRQYALESLRESLTLDYASYILALAMDYPALRAERADLCPGQDHPQRAARAVRRALQQAAAAAHAPVFRRQPEADLHARR